MPFPLSLREIINSLEMVSDQVEFYLNRETGEIIELLKDVQQEWDWENEEIETEDLEDWQKEIRLLGEKVISSDIYIPFPTKFEIFEYRIMEDFCLSYPDEKISRFLCKKIRGRGAFRRFKDAIYNFEIEKEWFDFKDKALKEIGISWLDENDLSYIDDIEGTKQKEG